MTQRLKRRAAILAVAMLGPAASACGPGQSEPITENRQSPPASTADPRPSLPPIDVEAIERQLAPGLSRSSRDLAVTSTRAGGAHVDLTGRFQHVTIARQKADGTIERSCVTTPEELSAFLRSDEAR